jgi:hypothetical protein
VRRGQIRGDLGGGHMQGGLSAVVTPSLCSQTLWSTAPC